MPTRRPCQPASFEHGEWKHFGGERGQQIEATAVIVQIHPRQGTPIGQTRGIQPEQKIAVFGMGIVVPAQSIIAKGEQRDDPDDAEHRDREPVEDAGRCQDI